MSDFVTTALKESGLHIPAKTMGIGVELPEDFDKIPAYPLKTKKAVKFLHISSAFPRKGVDVLLKAYFEAFTKEDDVCLILKTFDNPHNEVKSQLEALIDQYPNPPEVEWINRDMPQNELFGLYKSVDCYVPVARGEGFGLPVAEAMLAKLPVIVSPNTGLADFCNEETAILVDYEMVPAQSHVSEERSLWAEPNLLTLTEKFRQFATQPESLELAEKISNAHRLISEKYTWGKVAQRWTDFIDEVQRIQDKPQVALVTTWNHKCGIAEYSRLLYEAMRNYVDFTIYPNYGVELIRRDEDFVGQRVWDSALSGDLLRLTEVLDQNLCTVVHFQFHMVYFNLEQ
ncbi:MAG: glycosyltransferase, partial [Bacillota bacterium]